MTKKIANRDTRIAIRVMRLLLFHKLPHHFSVAVLKVYVQNNFRNHELTVTICNTLGQIICSRKTSGISSTINIVNTSSGIYIVKVTGNDKRESRYAYRDSRDTVTPSQTSAPFFCQQFLFLLCKFLPGKCSHQIAVTDLLPSHPLFSAKQFCLSHHRRKRK